MSNLDMFSVVPVGCAFAVSSDDKLLMYTIFVIVVAAIVFAVVLSKESKITNQVFHVFLMAMSFILPTSTTVIFSTFPCMELDTGER